MRMRFWSGITRGQEKWVKLSLGHFLEGSQSGYHAPFPPKPYMNASRKTSGIGSVVAGLIDCVRISGLVCGLPGLPGEATGPDADTLTAASSGRRTLEVRGFGQAYAITV